MLGEGDRGSGADTPSGAMRTAERKGAANSNAAGCGGDVAVGATGGKAARKEGREKGGKEGSFPRGRGRSRETRPRGCGRRKMQR